MEDEFDYVIAREWGQDYPGELACYMIHNSEIQRGCIEDANLLLDYVKRQSPESTWHIYRVIFDRVLV